MSRGLVKNLLQTLTQDAIYADQKHAALAINWTNILAEMVRSAVVDMWDRSSYQKRCLEQLDKGKLMTPSPVKDKDGGATGDAGAADGADLVGL